LGDGLTPFITQLTKWKWLFYSVLL